MPRKTRKPVLVETPTDPEELPVGLMRQGTFTKTPDDSSPKPDPEAQENASTPPRATRGRTRKNKKKGSPPKPTRTMPRRGRKHVQFADDVETINEEVADVKENVEPLQLADPGFSSPPKGNRKRTRRTKKVVELPSDPEPPVSLVRKGSFTRSPDQVQCTKPPMENASETTIASHETSQKRSRKGKRSKEEQANPQTLVREGTFTKSPEGNAILHGPGTRRGSPREKGRGKRSNEEPINPKTLVREGTFTKSPEQNVTLDAPETRSDSPQKREGRSGRAKRSKEEPNGHNGLIREGTFSKSPEKQLTPDPESLQRSLKGVSVFNSADVLADGGNISQEAQPGLVREGTFTKSPEKDLTNTIAESPQQENRKRKRSPYAVIPETGDSQPVIPDSTTPIQTPKRLHKDEETDGSPVPQRRATFTKTPRRSKRPSRIQTDQENMPMLKREGTFTKCPEKEPVCLVFIESAETGQNAEPGALELKREGAFTKSPEKEVGAIPDFQATENDTPVPIQNLSVFQRLSTKIPRSERRSLVSSEKRGSLRNKFLTPQTDKKTQLIALREARKNHLTPKSITFKRGTTPSTPVQSAVQSVNKTASSTNKPKSAVKKPPNFAAIHERNFAKMESLLENKKRHRERANFLMSPLRPTQASGIPKLVKKGVAPVANAAPKKSNIPIMKMAAKERLKAAVANKCTTGALLKAQDSKVLKGVRTNKRFELLLKQKNRKIQS